MAFTPTVGQVAVLDLTIGAGVQHWKGPGINWKFSPDPKITDKSNFRDGRIKNRTLDDAQITLTLVYDQADSPLKAAGGNVLIGSSGTARLFVDATNFISCPILVGPVGVENPGMEDDLMLDVTLELNGAITWPAGV